jgi:YegS/Rv2252/BmrU family lipid kinase
MDRVSLADSSTQPARHRAAIIFNPSSGSRDAHAALQAIRTDWRKRGWSLTVHTTRAPGDASRLARYAAQEGVEVVLVAGGDGTLNEAINALVDAPTAVGVLPIGTANVWARQMHLPVAPRRLIDAARLLQEARVCAIDLGRVTLFDDARRSIVRHFLLWSGVGLDASVTRAIEPRGMAFKRLGALGYTLKAARRAMGFRSVPVEIELDDRSLHERVIQVVVSNTRLYAGNFHLAPRAQLDDGLFEVSVFRGQGFRAVLGHFLRMFFQRHLRGNDMQSFQAQHVRVTSSARCDVHVDAEPIGMTPAEFTIVPRALRVLVPDTAPAALFRQ